MKFIRKLFKGREKSEITLSYDQFKGEGNKTNSNSKSSSLGIRENRNAMCCDGQSHGVRTLPTTTTLSPGIPGKKCFVEDGDGNRVEFKPKRDR